MKKLFIRTNSPYITYLFLFFTGRKGTSTGRLRDPVAERPWDQMMKRSKDVRETLVEHVFEIKLTNTSNLL